MPPPPSEFFDPIAQPLEPCSSGATTLVVVPPSSTEVDEASIGAAFGGCAVAMKPVRRAPEAFSAYARA